MIRKLLFRFVGTLEAMAGVFARPMMDGRRCELQIGSTSGIARVSISYPLPEHWKRGSVESPLSSSLSGGHTVKARQTALRHRLQSHSDCDWRILAVVATVQSDGPSGRLQRATASVTPMSKVQVKRNLHTECNLTCGILEKAAP